ncbi:GDCCVxC domain-containing (seleno)protein [Bradyrhizobium prioriisuperbiae]|uniref:GDCCVxC domain-containing (seleno)protein n=1 Tax=Bradyrhizobium prioriisuperbiae TaxID=2854389 RepID=UPI0028E54F37|nr:GDCCVxC domain-containing (seleno)protein [Bradyrhizobium prioritasuperba]
MTQLTSNLTCPVCGHQASERMPTDACQFFYECKGCGALLKPKAGDCCVFCSYGDVPCPPIQEARAGRQVASCCSGAVDG